MPLIVEDGTGVEDANGYITINFADDYFAAIGYAAWDLLDDPRKEQAIIEATVYVDARWGRLLRGIPEFAEQVLEFPRRRLYDRYGRPLLGIPTEWKKAVAEYAKTASTKSLYPTPTSAQKVIRKRVTVGPITTETGFSESGGTEGDYLPYPLADQLARKFTNSGLGTLVIR